MKVLFLNCQLLKRLPRNLNDASLLGTLPHSQPNGTLGYISLVRSTMSHKMVKRSSPKFFRSLTYSFNYLFMLFSQYWRIFSVQSIDSGATSNSKNHSDPRETHHISCPVFKTKVHHVWKLWRFVCYAAGSFRGDRHCFGVWGAFKQHMNLGKRNTILFELIHISIFLPVMNLDAPMWNKGKNSQPSFPIGNRHWN